MRSLFLFTRVAFVALPVALVGACGETNTVGAGSSTRGRANEEESFDAPKTSFSDAATGTAPKTPGLCGTAQEECFPDNDGLTDDTYGCATPADSGVAPRGCRVEQDGDGGAFAPKCLQANAKGTDGVPCKGGKDCAPGFDCIEEEKTPVCRRYCCSGSCESQPSQNGGDTFCDIGKLANLSRQRMVPVCMPIKTCKLLKEGECSETETCGVVTEQGDTGCVPKGDANVGEQCESQHCASSLTCLGAPGERRCFQLCRVDAANCPSTQTCTTGSVFPDTTYGICKD